MIGQKLLVPFLWLMFAAFPFFACKSALKNKPITPRVGFDWQGHRGCRGLMPENSLPAFLHALDFPEVVTLELDLAVSKDNQLIISHEPWFNPAICLLPSGDSIPQRDAEKNLIYQFTASEIQAFDCGSLGNARFPQQQKQRTYKPTLAEVVAAVRAKAVGRTLRWNIEIKSQPEWDGLRHPPVEEFVRLTIAGLKSLGLENTATVQSFDVRALQALHRQAPNISLVLLVENIWGMETNLKKLGFTPQIYSPYYQLVSKKMVQKCHAKNIQVIPWTVNDVASMRGMIHLGVDGIITDYPNLIREVGKDDGQ